MGLQGWEIALLAVASFVAITAMVRLMRQRRDQLTRELLQQAEEEHRRQQDEERKAKAKQKKAG
jgi:hypothetical protein